MTTGNPDLPPQHPIPTAADPSTPHKEAGDTEEIYFQGSPYLRGELGRLVGWGVIGLIFIALPFVYHFLSREKVWWPAMVNLILIAIGLILCSVPLLLAKSVRYRISNYRIDYERGWLSKSIDTLELWHVEDITFHQSLLNRIAGVGTIVVLSHDDTTPRLELTSLPHPRPLFETLKQRVIAVKRQRGVMKVDGGY